MANFMPTQLFKIKNGDGTTSTAEAWNYGDIGSGTYKIDSRWFIFFGMLIIGWVATPIVFLITLLTFTGQRFIPVIATLIVSGYYMIDYHHYWIATITNNYFIGESNYKMIMALNTGVFYGSLCLLAATCLYSEKLFDLKKNKETVRFNTIATGTKIVVIFCVIMWSFIESNNKTVVTRETIINSKSVDDMTVTEYDEYQKLHGLGRYSDN